MKRQFIKFIMGLILCSLSVSSAYADHSGVFMHHDGVANLMETNGAEIESQCIDLKNDLKTGTLVASTANLLGLWKFGFVMSYGTGALLTLVALWLAENSDCDSGNIDHIYYDDFPEEDDEHTVFHGEDYNWNNN